MLKYFRVFEVAESEKYMDSLMDPTKHREKTKKLPLFCSITILKDDSIVTELFQGQLTVKGQSLSSYYLALPKNHRKVTQK